MSEWATTPLFGSDPSNARGQRAGASDPFEYALPRRPKRSSGSKRTYKGFFVTKGGARIGAVKVFFDPAYTASFGVECANLARNEQLGVGPRILAIGYGCAPGERKACPFIVEQDAGVSLSAALKGTPIPGKVAQPLLSPDHPDAERQVAKILLDVMCELMSLHSHGLFHGDVKSPNIAVRSIGPNPWDVRATLIDFDLSSAVRLGAPANGTQAYRRRLFASRKAAPRPLELDLGCLALVACELRHGRPITKLTREETDDILGGKLRFFSLTPDGIASTSMLTRELDIDPLAKVCGLARIEDCGLPQRVLPVARNVIRHGGYADAEDLEVLGNVPEVILAMRSKEMGRLVFERYQESILASGETPAYETFDDQPTDLQESCYAQAEHAIAKVEALGYVVVPKAEAEPPDVVTSFAAHELKRLALMEHRRWFDERTRQGWVFGPVRDDDRKVNPLLVPYEQLPAKDREKNLLAARDVIPLLDYLGLSVVRP